jgi:hypothetical protein
VGGRFSLTEVLNNGRICELNDDGSLTLVTLLNLCTGGAAFASVAVPEA